MDDDWAVEFTKIVDTFDYGRDNVAKKYKQYTFYVGKHGPFVERVDAVPFDPYEIDRRVSALRTSLMSLPK